MYQHTLEETGCEFESFTNIPDTDKDFPTHVAYRVDAMGQDEIVTEVDIDNSDPSVGIKELAPNKYLLTFMAEVSVLNVANLTTENLIVLQEEIGEVLEKLVADLAETHDHNCIERTSP